jgi:hypothetical protein
MEYRQFAAPPDLAPWVECAWTLRGALPRDGQMILPDGRLELIFHLGEAPLGQPLVMAAGRMLEGVTLRAKAPLFSVGLRLRPGAAQALLPCAALGAVEDLEGVAGPWARRAREALGSGDVEELWRLLRERRRVRVDDAVQWSVAAMEAARGRGPVDEFLPDGLRTRQWQRRFLHATGFSPKGFARIVRLQNTIALASTGRLDWGTLALEAGFYDQAHLTNEFRSFTGTTPRQYFAAQLGMAEFYHDAFFQDGVRDSR